jgi:hypothetical protein
LGGVLALLPLMLHAATIVKGRAIDETAAAGIAGVTLELRQGERVLARAASDQDGAFTLVFDIGLSPQAQAVTLLASHPDFVAVSKNIAIASGAPDSPFYPLELLPARLARCRLQRGHNVVVGYFRSPASAAPYSELASRIADALTYSLLTRLQEVHVPTALQPLFLACEDARPRTIALSGSLARALGAAAFLSGDVKQQDATYRISAYVADPFELFVPPLRTVNEQVDLDDPGAAQLDPDTHAAILTAIAASYEEEQRYAECVDVTVAAERILGGLSAVLEQARTQCQRRLAHRGLLPGGSP